MELISADHNRVSVGGSESIKKRNENQHFIVVGASHANRIACYLR